MCYIYRQARGTIVWLGEETNDSPLAFQLIEAWAEAEEDYDEFNAHYPLAFEETSWIALENLLKRPWWERVWVYQEFVVARIVYFVCGSESIHFQRLNSAERSWNKFLSKATVAVLFQNLSLVGYCRYWKQGALEDSSK